MGGRWRRPAGDIYDSIAIDYDYGDGVHVATYGRQMPGGDLFSAIDLALNERTAL